MNTKKRKHVMFLLFPLVDTLCVLSFPSSSPCSEPGAQELLCTDRDHMNGLFSES